MRQQTIIVKAMRKKTALKAIENPATTVLKETASVIPFVIKTVFILGVGYFIYNQYTNRFKKMKEVNSYRDANVTEAGAKSKAEIIAGSIGWFSNDFDTVRDALAGLNYNGFVRVYNAFGFRTGTLLAGDLDLIQWCQNQFTSDEVEELAFMFNGYFFG